MKESKWQHDINDPAIMHEMYDEYVADAITFMKAHKDGNAGLFNNAAQVCPILGVHS